jgi:hypothetical protein
MQVNRRRLFGLLAILGIGALVPKSASSENGYRLPKGDCFAVHFRIGSKEYAGVLRLDGMTPSEKLRQIHHLAENAERQIGRKLGVLPE